MLKITHTIQDFVYIFWILIFYKMVIDTWYIFPDFFI